MNGGNKVLARVHYTIYKGDITISFIEAVKKCEGYGKILMLYLAKKYGYENLKRSSLTPDGAKMRAALDHLFDFNYEEFIKSQSKHLHFSDIEKVKDETIKSFLISLVKYGYEKAWDHWSDYLRDNGYFNKYDMNDVAEIANWITDSETNGNYIDDQPPSYVIELLKSLQ